ncbi:hypothetical protein HAX54_034217 [Datura stramonium]|uniref:Pentatricopeptide repeat-containing protein n=1 Tax=Datura stramonium TaxID=4076 RepID=A0ABS8VG75_DATST|nr:hypothetical protein [Datura stramonium]
MVDALKVFDEIPDKNVVSWNICLKVLIQSGDNYGIRPSGYTFSILISYVESAFHGKEIHGNMLRNGVDLSNIVVGNTLIDMYGKLGLVDYATGVFLAMETVDVISWNSLISSCCKSGCEDTALCYFSLMRA